MAVTGAAAAAFCLKRGFLNVTQILHDREMLN
jgi:hypothetical protein